MVNTRRTESGGSHRYHTRRTNDGVRQIDSSSGSESETEEIQGGDDDSWSPQGKTNLIRLNKSDSALPSRVRELRSRFVCENRKFKSYHLRKTDVNASRKHTKLKDRLEVYVAHKHRIDNMDSYNPNDSEEDGYSPRHTSRRRHRSIVSRVERRTALSLRPLTAKSYVDRSPMTCHSDDSDVVGVRRSARQRNPQYKSLGSWITDDQMPKKGYPNAEEYSEEDSRDVPVKRIRREIKKNTRYMNDYQTTDIPTNRRRLRNEEETRSKPSHSLRTHRNLYDGRDAKERIPRSTRQTRNSGGKPENEDNMEEEETSQDLVENAEVAEDVKSQLEESNGMGDNSIEEETKVNKAVKKEVQKNGISDKSTNDEVKVEDINKRQSSESDIPPKTTRNRGSNRIFDGYCLRKNRQIRKISESSTSSEEGRVYALRERVPKQSAPIMMRELSAQPPRTENRRNRNLRRFRRKRTPSSSDSSDSDERCRNKYSKTPKSPHSKNEQPLKSGAGGSKIIPIGPETLDSNVRFSSVGGLDSHIQCLKEMVLLPMMYPEVFEKFQVQPPRGVLFHGPPGTGKTLIARALANECCFGARKVSFFMRKGADLLSKWIGESEKQLRLLFEQAAEMKPSIIFFDEIDGLAPIRSSRQDQVHASIVSTLLALMDGFDNRGEVIVIGATNRIDAIDPALRRPGRFDRELYFPLPAKKEREEIIKVHISKWASKPNDNMISYLAENSVGYCGSDLRALCSEAVIQSFRRNYPQVYNSGHKLLLDPEQVKIEKVDFLRAKSYLVPSSHRSGQRTGRKLIASLQPLLEETLKEVHGLLAKIFPHGADPNLAKVKLAAGFRPAQFLIVGDSNEHGQTNHLAPAILHTMEHINIHVLDIATLYRESGRSAEEACIQVFQEVKRNLPSVLYIPCIDQWWDLVSEAVITIFNAQLQSLEPNSPILVFATANTIYQELPEKIQFIFSSYRKEVYELKPPSLESRKNFFKRLIIDTSIKRPRSPRKRPKTPPVLPKAPTPPPAPMTEDQKRKLYEVEEHTLRELRIFLRDMCKKLANNRLFYMFTKPVDTEEVPDYPTIIKQPMDLETMMMKVDFHKYECAKDFLNDIELIVQNALEYNPAKTTTDKQIRHRACSLRDYAYTLIKNEMDSDFEDKCQDIAKKRVERKASTSQYLPPFLQTQPEEIALVNGKSDIDQDQKKTLSNGNASNGPSTVRTSPSRKRKISSWQRGLLTSHRKRPRKEKIINNEGNEENVEEDVDDKSSIESKDNNGDSENTTGARVSYSEDSQEVTAPLTVNCNTASDIKSASPLQSPNTKRRLSDLMSPSELLEDTLDFDDVDQALNESTIDFNSKQIVEISEIKLHEVLNYAVEVTTNRSLQSLLDLHYQLSRIIKQYSRTYNRQKLPEDLMNELKLYKEEIEKESIDLSEDLETLRNT